MSNFIAKNDEKLINSMIDSLKNRDVDELNKINVALQAFYGEPVKKVKKRLQAVGVSTDFDRVSTNAFNVTIEEDNFDLGYEQAFRVVPKDAGKDFWQIYDVQNGLSFRKMPEGGRLEVEGLTGNVVNVFVDYYGGALGWTDRMIRYRQVAAMVDKAMIFRNKFWTNKADNHYILLAVAAAGTIIAWQGIAADGQLRRDILTLNAGTFTLTNRLKDKGYGNMANAPLLLYANPFDEDRIEAAFRVTTNALATVAGVTGIGQTISSRPVKRIYTYNASIDAGAPILVLPGQKIQRNDDMQPTTYTQPKDPLTLNEVQAVWAIYGATVADTDQCLQLTLG